MGDTNQLAMVPVQVKIDQVVAKVEATFKTALEQRKLTLVVQDLAGLPSIQGDKDLLYKLFYHVIMNAIKFTPDGGNIFVNGCPVDKAQPQVEVMVKDTGIGIDPQNQELVFQKFYQTGELLLAFLREDQVQGWRSRPGTGHRARDCERPRGPDLV